MNFEEKVLNYVEKYISEEGEENPFSSCFEIAFNVSMYAHRNQRRINGDAYFSHPYRCVKRLREFIDLEEFEPSLDSIKLLDECGIPFLAVDEVCLLHDVLEDTEVSVSEIAEIYHAHGFGEFFDEYIIPPLEAITHKDRESDEEYLEKLLKDPVASLVKLADHTDNLNLLTLIHLGDDEAERCKKNIDSARRINDKYHYLENVMMFRYLKRKLPNPIITEETE